ncbi:MAG: PaaI family thioesterase [Proteobacteria bacterium]|nr:PaaI family thioesterase [Pseudomonadota bacterium]
MDEIRSWLEASPYGAGLGVEARAVSEQRVHLALPFQHSNSNGDKALHGGVVASMIDLAGQAVARAALGAESAPWHTAAIQVAYLAAALGEAIEAEATLLRRGKELAFASVSVRTEDGKPVAQGLVSVRGRFAAALSPPPEALGDDGAEDLGPMGPFLQRVPFHGKLGLSAEHMAGGRSRIVMPWCESNADAAGGVHEGALLALLDTTGAMAAWAETGLGRFKASTPGIQARIFAPPPRAELVGYGRVLYRDRELFFCEVEIVDREHHRAIARGTVNYRIVTPEHTR